jgi:hypothetical protein
MKSGIPSIDSSLGAAEFPQEGLVTITGTCDAIQTAVMKEITKNIASYYSQSIIISSMFASWTTKDIVNNAKNLWHIETEPESIGTTIAKVCLAQTRGDYPLLLIDRVPNTATLIEMGGIRKLLEDKRGKLTIINCVTIERKMAFDLQAILSSKSNLVLNISKKNDNIELRMTGPYIQSLKNI